MDEDLQKKMEELKQKHVKFLQQNGPEMERLWLQFQEDHDRKTLHELVAIVHRISGTSATFGFPELSETAGKLEEAILERDDEGVSPSADDLAAWGGMIACLSAGIPV